MISLKKIITAKSSNVILSQKQDLHFQYDRYLKA